MTRVAVEPPVEETLHVIGEGLRAYNIEAGGASAETHEFVVTARAEDGTLIGGFRCEVYLGGLFVEWAFVDAAHRGSGLGRAMLDAAEAEGARRGATFAHLDTFSFQARGFYERCGYAVFGVLPYPSGVERFYMKKALSGAEGA